MPGTVVTETLKKVSVSTTSTGIAQSIYTILGIFAILYIFIILDIFAIHNNLDPFTSLFILGIMRI